MRFEAGFLHGRQSVRFWPGTEISAIDLLAEYLPFSSVEHEQGRRNSQRQVVAVNCLMPAGC